MKSIFAGIAGAMLATAGLAAEPPSVDSSSSSTTSSTTSTKSSDTKKLGSTEAMPSKGSFSEASAKDLAAIKEVATNVAKSFNDGDAKSAAQYFTNDARLYNVTGKQASGRDDIERLINEDLNGIMKDTNTNFTNIEVKMLKPDLAFVDMDQELTPSKTSDSTAQPQQQNPQQQNQGLPRIHVSSLAVKQGGKWMVLEARAGALLEQQPTTSS